MWQTKMLSYFLFLLLDALCVIIFVWRRHRWETLKGRPQEQILDVAESEEFLFKALWASHIPVKHSKRDDNNN